MLRIPAQRLLYFSFGTALTLVVAALAQTTETRAAKRYRALEKLDGMVRTADPSSIDPYDEGHIIRISGLATTDEVLEDPVFGVRANALILERRVETFQWVEVDRDGRWEYEGRWAEDLIDASSFAEPEGRGNPSEHRFSRELTIASRVSLGEFDVPLDLIDNIQEREPVSLESLDGLEGEASEARLLGDTALFFGQDPNRPMVGDTRVSFVILQPLEVHLLGRQRGKTLEHFGGRSGPGYMLLKLDRKALFPNIDRVTPLEIWTLRFLMIAGLAAGLSLLRLTLRVDLRPPRLAILLLAVSAGSAIAASTWRVFSVLHASTAAVLALLALLAALKVTRQFVVAPDESPITF